MGTTHIIIGATIAEHGNVPAATLEDEKGQGIKCHGCEGPTSLALVIYINEAPTVVTVAKQIKQLTYSVTLLCFFCATVPLPYIVLCSPEMMMEPRGLALVQDLYY